jgi:hypothetical protein
MFEIFSHLFPLLIYALKNDKNTMIDPLDGIKMLIIIFLSNKNKLNK